MMSQHNLPQSTSTGLPVNPLKYPVARFYCSWPDQLLKTAKQTDGTNRKDQIIFVVIYDLFFVLLFFLILSTSFINKFQFLLLIMMLMILLSCETLGNIRTISRSTLGHFQKINFLNFSFILFTFKLQILGLSYCDISKTKL